ncbi:MAG: MarR family transcriptional regulator [Chitinophagales bacterium]|nr:MarR family transcriptional regulator [Chitinophagales bacterium]
MQFNTPTNTVLYTIEEAIKGYRKMCLRNISHVVPDITVDQALILIIINDLELTQTEIAGLLFKDNASMTRILGLMVKKNYIIKTADETDGRKSKLKTSKKGRSTLEKIRPIIEHNRKTALKNITTEEQNILFNILKRISKNCAI